MKTIFKTLLLLIFANGLHAQECTSWYPAVAGNSWEMSQYDKKDKLTGTSTSTVNTVETLPNGYSADITVKSSDAKGKESGTATMALKCIDGVFYFDMKNFIDPSTAESYKDMEISVEATDMQFPSSLSAGQKLPDASIISTVKSNGMTVMTQTVNITNRVVEGQESITTPAGTFDCWKINYTIDTKMMMMKNHFSCTDYLSAGAGVVKTTSMNDKGELISYSVLTKLTR